MTTNTIINNAKKFFGQFETLSQLDHYLCYHKEYIRIVRYSQNFESRIDKAYFIMGKLLIEAVTGYRTESIDRYRIYLF